MKNCHCWRKLMLLLCLAAAAGCVQQQQEKKGKMESWIHVHPGGLKSHFEEYKEFGRRSKEAGYTTIMTRFIHRKGYDKELARKLLEYYKTDLGLKVIPEFELLGKSQMTFGDEFVKEHPELFVGQVIDPYAKYEGKPAFDSLIIPMVDEHIELFGNPEYFGLGWDEHDNDNIKEVADKNGKTISEVWAGTLNRVNDYLLSQNITPIIFGDQLISKQLAKEDNPVGYPADKRFENYSATHGVYPPQSKIDMIEFVKDIRNMDKIVMADWHYGTEKEYPSVDYFKWLGFKEVIPVTWGKDSNMKYFSKYAASRGSTKMMASVWHYSYHPTVRHLLWPTVYNSILYFENPDMAIPVKPKINVLKDGKPIISAEPGETITLSMSEAGKDVEFEVYPANKMLREDVITIKGDKWKLPDNVKEGLWTIQGYSRRKDGYLLHGMLEAGLYIGKQQLAVEREKTSFISVDFSKCARFGKNNQYVILNGISATNFGIIEDDTSIKDGALVCKKGGMRAGRSNSDCDSMSGNKTVMVEFKVDKFPGEEQEEGASILGWGCFNDGFRIILWHKKLYVQIFGVGNRKVYLISKSDLELGGKYLAVFNMNDKKATLFLNGVEQAEEQVDLHNEIPITFPLSVGCSYKKDRLVSCFDGAIYRFAIWNKFIDEKTAGK
ncbi:MAG: hypothetical protein A2020_15670 [Lentisphaerae bacterium GWF2_45_14]|nr:MAG: hypothetical protein A2020_15670 [Lentisphaerae bacterium GWF2_45_14]